MRTGMSRCLLRNVSAALNPAGPLPMAMKPGAATFPAYHFEGRFTSVVRLSSDLLDFTAGAGVTGLVGRVAAIAARQTAVWEHLRMSSPEDPEERIRQLEQQSANYGAVELGATGGSAPPPPPTAPLPPPVYTGQVPVPPYGDPYGGNPYQPPFGTQFTPVQKKSSGPIVVIVVAVAVGVLAVLGGIAAVVWNAMSTTSSVISNIPTVPSGVFDQPSINVPIPEIPTMPSIPMAPGEQAPTGAPGQPLSIAGVEKNQTVACNDARVNVSGVNNTITLTGHCMSVTVSGVNNHVTVEATDVIGASGFDNQVIYQSGDPEIDATGSNTVQKG